MLLSNIAIFVFGYRKIRKTGGKTYGSCMVRKFWLEWDSVAHFAK